MRNLSENVNDEATIHAIVQMATDLGLSTIAEGVEDDATLEKLRQPGCDGMQGYLIAKPMPAERSAQFVRAWRT